ncbi:galactose mutarotase-like protein [Trichodelitschia bisporula]|uniref:Galactose mutarotase-like protein n=1 Tax=Trichodelitschia bisporula TaxID=703511 RepID=A0A6G1HX89_9PEZI|nr:galactose mutarotase-like protein [Trichodelitschia bisporula]
MAIFGLLVLGLVCGWAGAQNATRTAAAVATTLATSASATFSPSALSPPGVPLGTFKAGPDADGKYTIAAEGIRAQFIAYGASVSNLYVKDRWGGERDVVLGYDNASAYERDASHPHLGGVPGRYANRIKNSTFSIEGKAYHVLPNENGGADTLHGGPDGWDWRNWTVLAHTPTSITFELRDPDGSQGFPGEVISQVTYTVAKQRWYIRMVAQALTKKTPIMLSSHVYWNLDAFQNPNGLSALNHTLYMPYSNRRIATDGILIPTGQLLANERGSVNDFWSEPRTIGEGFGDPAIAGNCGGGCVGYDTCYLVNRTPEEESDWRGARRGGPVAVMGSEWSGIRVAVYTEQEAFQVYSCNGQNGTMPIKSNQGNVGGPRTVPQYGCVVLEVEDWIDGINHPEWERQARQVFGPGDAPYVLEAEYRFSVEE